MKQFYKRRLWLRIALPAMLVAVCVTINAIAFTEIWRSVQATRQPQAPIASTTEANNLFTGSPLSDSPLSERPLTDSPLTDSPLTAAKPAPALDPEATIDEAKAQLAPKTTAVFAPAIAQKHGHFAYPVQQPEDLILVASYAEGDSQRNELLHPDAAEALHKMIAAARINGIWIVPASGFRSLEQQRSIFSNQTLKKGSPEAAALVSAPPGYSEHHTGYAVDLADGSLSQDNDISIAFAQSPAYKWLSENAAQFGFELSFPEGNPQGIAFEPWHWRYVGTQEAKQLFSAAPEQAAPRQSL